jgi:hypothetical protein
MNMEKEEFDEKTLIINKTIGFILVVAGVYGLLIAFKSYKNA